MPIGIRLPMQFSGKFNHYEVFKAEILGYAGPRIAKRSQQTSAGGQGMIFVDRGYPFSETMNIHAWQFYNPSSGFVDIGDVICLVCFAVAGDIIQVRHALPMSVRMDGEGVWEHAVLPVVAATAGDLVGIWCRQSPSGAGIIPNMIYDKIGDNLVGAYFRNTGVNTAPTAGTQYGTISTVANAFRGSIQARGPGTGGAGALSYTQVNSFVAPTQGPTQDQAFRNGDGPIVPTFQALGTPGAAPAYYVHTIVGAFPNTASATANLFDLDSSSSITVPAGASGRVSIRLADGAGALPVDKIVMNPQLSTDTSQAQVTVGLFYSNAATDAAPDTISDWVQFFSHPTDWQLPPTTAPAPPTNVTSHAMLSRKVKWIQMRYTNPLGTSQGARSFLVFPFAAAAIVGTQFIPNFNDQNAEFFWATKEGVTMKLTTAVTGPDAAPTVLNVAEATVFDMDGIAVGQSIWIRNGSLRYRYQITAINVAGRTITVADPLNLAQGVRESHSIGELIDTRLLVLRVDGYDTALRKIRESPPLIAGGTWREKWFQRGTVELV